MQVFTTHWGKLEKRCTKNDWEGSWAKEQTGIPYSGKNISHKQAFCQKNVLKKINCHLSDFLQISALAPQGKKAAVNEKVGRRTLAVCNLESSLISPIL